MTEEKESRASGETDGAAHSNEGETEEYPRRTEDASTVDWKDRRTGKRRAIGQHGYELIAWPKASPQNREMFDTWYGLALRRVYEEGAGCIQTLASFPLIVINSSGTFKRTNPEIAVAAGGCTGRTVARHLDDLEALGLIVRENGWRRSKFAKNGRARTRVIRLTFPADVSQADGDHEAKWRDNGGHSVLSDEDDSGGHSDPSKEDDHLCHSDLSDTDTSSGGRSDNGGRQSGDTGGHYTTSVYTSGADATAGACSPPVEPSFDDMISAAPGGGAQPPAGGSAQPSTSQSQTEAHDITTGPADAVRPASGRDKEGRPFNTYQAIKKEGWS